MLLAQFGSNTAQGYKPVWFAHLVNMRVNEEAQARSALEELPWSNFGKDGFGARRAPLTGGRIDAEGGVYCTAQYTISEYEREVRKHVGQRDWLVGYRYASCACGTCGEHLSFCRTCGREKSVNWYARRCRLQGVSVMDAPMASIQDTNGILPVKLGFTADTAWQLMDNDRWAFGLPEAPEKPNDIWDTEFDLCNPPIDFHEMRWPCDLPPCTPITPLRFYRRVKLDWEETYCIGYWTAGKWIRGAVGTNAVLHVSGDTWPLSRLAFTNFTELEVTICSPSGQECTFKLTGPVAEPQYALVSPQIAAEVRYCPINDDACLDNVPAAYNDVAVNGTRFPVASQTCPLVGQLWPGRNIIRFEGFRLPSRPFHWSYDYVPQYI